MNNAKITVPPSVAAAIAHYVALADTKTEALTDILSLGYEAERSKLILRYFAGNYDELMEALVCGYEVETIPGECKVRALYEDAELKDGAQHSEFGSLYYSGIMYGIKKTLNTLGIQIEGVNA